MTSPRKFQSLRTAQEELRVFNSLSRALRDAINNAETSVRPSVVLSTLLRGVPEQSIIDTISLAVVGRMWYIDILMKHGGSHHRGPFRTKEQAAALLAGRHVHVA